MEVLQTSALPLGYSAVTLGALGAISLRPRRPGVNAGIGGARGDEFRVGKAGRFGVAWMGMADAVQELYSSRDYPALSHPEADVATLAMAGRCAGFPVVPPQEASVLEIGCGSGHHLLPLAARYPRSEFVGIDAAAEAVARARRAAAAAGLENVRFEVADLRACEVEEGAVDYLIAHGMLSWVPAEARDALWRLAGRALSVQGVASISFNTLPGWALRSEAAALAKGLQALGGESAGWEPLVGKFAQVAGISATPYGRHLESIYRDMLRKSEEVLAFDDFGPVCEPFHFARVAAWAGEAGLRYLGESALAGNLPPGLAPDVLPQLQPLAADAVRFQQALDLFSGRTHRTSLFGRAATDLEPAGAAAALDGAVRLVEMDLPPEVLPGEVATLFHASLRALAPSAVPVARVLENTAARLGSRWDPERGARDVAGWLFQAARIGWVELRADAVEVEPVPPVRPRLSALNLHFARERQPLVDAFHRTCGFPEAHREVVAALDGTRTRAELEELAREVAPDLHFQPWLVHLAARGFFPAG